MAESHFRAVLARLELNGDERLEAFGCVGYPGVLRVAGAIDAEEASVAAPLVHDCEIEEAGDCRR